MGVARFISMKSHRVTEITGVHQAAIVFLYTPIVRRIEEADRLVDHISSVPVSVPVNRRVHDRYTGPDKRPFCIVVFPYHTKWSEQTEVSKITIFCNPMTNPNCFY